MNSVTRRLVATGFAAALAMFGVCLATAPSAEASEIKYIVNNTAITTYDVQKRAAFLKLQHRAGASAKMAADDMVEQTLKSQELEARKVKISKAAVDASFAKFAASNKMSVKQLTGVLDHAGVTAPHFKEFIRVQMGWGQLLSSRFRAEGGMSEQDAVQKMLQQGGTKPSATEYLLQQVIFVVPASERAATLGKRKREAEAMRLRFTSCETTREFAKGLIDVTVKDIPRVLAPQLPPDWADNIKNAKPGTATAVRETERGIEFIGVCSSREVSDDRVAQMVFSNDSKGDDKKGDELNKKYLDELRKKAVIVER
jgi:peptidyl-prolyl cis-trans isomerase SurA